jgi:CHAT domain-containing protein
MTLGESAMSAGRMAAAQQYFQTAQEIRQAVFGPTLPSIKTFVTLGRAFHSEGIDTSAVAAYRQAFSQMVNNQGVKADFLSNEELIDFVAAALNLISRKEFNDGQKLQLLEEVFYAFQMVRPSVVDKTIVQSTSALSKNDPVLGTHLKAMMDLDRQITSKRADLAEQNILPDQERDVDLETKLLAEIKQLEATQKIFKQDLSTKFPAFTAMATPGPIALSKMQERLRAKDAMVTYLLGRKESFALLIKKTVLHIARIPSGEKKLAASVQTLRKGLQPQAGGLGDFDVEESYDLYSQVLEPFTKQLEEVNHLIVNATGSLASLPFAVLVTEEPNGNGEKLDAYTAWLSRKFAISYVSSVQAFVALRSRDKTSFAAKAFFGIGNPKLDGKPGTSTGALDKLAGDCRSDSPASAEMLRALAALPDTGKEIQAVGKMLAPKEARPWRLGTEAVEEQVRRLPLDQYRVLYFATHGLLPGELKCQTEPALVLTPPTITPKDKNFDGLLQASEISTLKLNADLVVLSACNTAGGSGKFGGEALSGLAEAFFYAGARGLVVSHWQVPSESTALLMTAMFSEIGPEFSVGPARALSQAQQFISKQKGKEHPYFWAAFTMIGDGGDDSLQLQRWDKNAFLQNQNSSTANF